MMMRWVGAATMASLLAFAPGCRNPAPGGPGPRLPAVMEVCDTLETNEHGVEPRAPADRGFPCDSSLLLGTVAELHARTAIPRALLSISRPASARVLSDSAGGFVFPPLKPGRYSLYVAALGYRPARMRVDLPAGRVERVQIHLRAERCHFPP